jgi:hypothetical protein
VERSDFGRSDRGRLLLARARQLVERGALRFSTELRGEALYRKERGSRPLLYVRVERLAGEHTLPTRAEMAERVFHETLHAVKDSARKSLEEECDAFCAAEEARAAIEGRLPRYPVTRDGQPVWKWVRSAYRDLKSDPEYRPVGRTLAELARRSGRPARAAE